MVDSPAAARARRPAIEIEPPTDFAFPAGTVVDIPNAHFTFSGRPTMDTPYPFPADYYRRQRLPPLPTAVGESPSKLLGIVVVALGILLAIGILNLLPRVPQMWSMVQTAWSSVTAVSCDRVQYEGMNADHSTRWRVSTEC